MLVCIGVITAHNPQNTSTKKFEFIENKGQWDNPSLYSVNLFNAHLYIEKNALQYFFYDKDDVANLVKHPRPIENYHKPFTVKGHALRISFLNSNINAKPLSEKPFTQYYNYFLGNDNKRWKSGVKPYSEVSIKNIYQGVDLKFYTQEETGSLKYDFIIEPGINTSSIKMKYDGADNMSLKAGALYVKTSVFDYIEMKPYAYQIIEGMQKEVLCEFVLEENVLSFKMGNYNTTLPIIIDPVVVFSTYSGSQVDNFGYTATYDNDGNAYIAGIVTDYGNSLKYPATAGAFQQNYNGGVGQWPQNGFPCDISVSKYNNDGSALIYATYLGGNRDEYPHSLIVDKQNRLIVFGSTHSVNFPITHFAFDTTFNSTTTESDIIVTKFNSDGTALVGSTYIGGSGWDGIMLADSLRMNYADEFRGEVQVNDANEIIIASTTSSSNFPTTTGAFQTTNKGGQEACVFKLDSSLKKLIWSSYLGESNHDAAYSLDIDVQGNIYVAGGTQSRNFPITTGVYKNTFSGGPVDGFIAKISANGSTLMRSMFWGSAKYDQTYFVKLDTKGKVNVLGQNFDSMPVTNNVYSNAKGSLYVSRFSKELDTLELSTVIGNGIQNNTISPTAFIVDACGNIYASCWGGEVNDYGNGKALYKTNFYSNTTNLTCTADALQKTTDGSDFFLFVLKKDAKSLFYSSFLGENGNPDHVDGGTSRFDKRGVIYQAICASCDKGKNGNFPTTSGSYSPKNKSPRCSEVCVKLDFRINDAVIADFIIAPRTGCSNRNVSFTNNSYNGKNYYWYVDGIFKDTTMNYQFLFPTKGTHSIKLIAIDSSRCIIIDSITKTLTIEGSVQSKFAVQFDTCSFKTSFVNQSIIYPGDTENYFWYFGDGDTSSQKNPIHIYKDSGNYIVKLISKPGGLCTDTLYDTINVKITPQMLYARMSINPLQSCLPSTVTFTNSSINGKKFLWYYDNVLKDSSLQFMDSFTTEKTIVVKLIVKDSVSCKKIDSVQQTLQTKSTTHAAFSYVMDTCGRTFQFFNHSTSYNNTPYQFVWHFGDGNTSTQQNPTHKYLSNNLFLVKLVTNPGSFCSDTAFSVIDYDSNRYYIVSNFILHPLVGCAPQFLFCENTVNNLGQHFYWYKNGLLQSTNFNYFDTLVNPNLYKIKLVITDSNTCNKSDSIQKNIFVNVSGKSIFEIYRDTCGPLIHFINKSTTYQNIPIDNYTWYFGDGTSSTYEKDPPPRAYKNGTYTIILISGDNTPCADTSSITFTYDSTSNIAKANFSLTDSTLCAPFILHTKNETKVGKHFYWFVNDIFKDTSRNLTDTILNSGTIKIKLVVVDSATCNVLDSITKTFNVNSKSGADFGIGRDSCSLKVTFNNFTSLTSNVPYKWYFGDGDSSTEINPIHQYPRTDYFNITLISNPGSPCADSVTKTFYIDGDTIEEVIIPNVFTPNGDGVNDFFEIRGVSQKCDVFHIWIYNRWENLFFESTDPKFNWNGKNEKGVEASEGVYVYLVDIKKRSGLHIHRHGTIELIIGNREVK